MELRIRRIGAISMRRDVDLVGVQSAISLIFQFSLTSGTVTGITAMDRDREMIFVTITQSIARVVEGKCAQTNLKRM